MSWGLSTYEPHFYPNNYSRQWFLFARFFPDFSHSFVAMERMVPRNGTNKQLKRNEPLKPFCLPLPLHMKINLNCSISFSGLFAVSGMCFSRTHSMNGTFLPFGLAVLICAISGPRAWVVSHPMVFAHFIVERVCVAWARVRAFLLQSAVIFLWKSSIFRFGGGIDVYGNIFEINHKPLSPWNDPYLSKTSIFFHSFLCKPKYIVNLKTVKSKYWDAWWMKTQWSVGNAWTQDELSGGRWTAGRTRQDSIEYWTNFWWFGSISHVWCKPVCRIDIAPHNSKRWLRTAFGSVEMILIGWNARVCVSRCRRPMIDYGFVLLLLIQDWFRLRSKGQSSVWDFGFGPSINKWTPSCCTKNFEKIQCLIVRETYVVCNTRWA